ncbi:MAG TPA: acyltransferase [Cyclobacteriaceae bacterium]
MRNFLKTIFYSLAYRFYSAGQELFLKKRDMTLRNKVKVGEKSLFYSTTDIVNLSNKPENIEIGKNCHIYGLLIVYGYSGSIKIGDNCSLSEYSRIVSGKKVTIGSRVMIAHNVNILDNNSHPIDARMRHEDFINAYSIGMQEYDLSAKEIVIEDDVWIGFNSIIMKGVKIGKGAIIGAGSVVTKDVEPWTVNAGNPLRCLRKLEPVDVEIKKHS